MTDLIVLRPNDIDLTRSPLRASLDEPTFVLGAFNPGLTRLPNGNLLMMARVAEALCEPVRDEQVRAIRWDGERYATAAFPLEGVDMQDPREFFVRRGGHRLMALTSLSWALPVELSADGTRVEAIHYDRVIAPRASYQEYGVEDPRISRIDDRWYMTVCCVSAERHGTALYTSDNGLDYRLEGLVLDHQNKDMLLFEGKVDGMFMALTRPMGSLYLAPAPNSPYAGGPSINLAQSPDGLHWKPVDRPGIRARIGSTSAAKVGGGAQPVLTEAGWLVIYHGVEPDGGIGAYRTFWAMLDRDDPSRILRLEDEAPLLEHDPELIAAFRSQSYLPSPVVFTTGVVDDGDRYILASGEADLACRITHVPKSRFA